MASPKNISTVKSKYKTLKSHLTAAFLFTKKELAMNKNTKITLAELIRRKEQMLESKKKPKTATLYIKSLGGTITIESPTADLARDVQDMDNGDAYMVYSCVTEPCLKSKELQTAFECVEPMEIVEKIFEPGEIPQIAVECLKLAGYVDGVKAVDDIKN